MDIYTIVLALHNIIRWVVLIAGLLAAGRAIFSWIMSLPWTQTDNNTGLFFTTSVDIQVLLGLVLYIFLSPFTEVAFADFGVAMGDDNLRYWAVEHIALMIGVLFLVHGGRVISKRQAEDKRKHMWAAIMYTLAFIVLLAGMPWFRPLLPSF
jgi:uncharacterized membrane protein YozB (DUF420 family)